MFTPCITGNKHDDIGYVVLSTNQIVISIYTDSNEFAGWVSDFIREHTSHLNLKLYLLDNPIRADIIIKQGEDMIGGVYRSTCLGIAMRFITVPLNAKKSYLYHQIGHILGISHHTGRIGDTPDIFPLDQDDRSIGVCLEYLKEIPDVETSFDDIQCFMTQNTATWNLNTLPNDVSLCHRHKNYLVETYGQYSGGQPEHPCANQSVYND